MSSKTIPVSAECMHRMAGYVDVSHFNSLSARKSGGIVGNTARLMSSNQRYHIEKH